MSKTQVFFRTVKAGKGHQFAGLYAVEKVKIKDNKIFEKEIVHEWDLRIISESILAKLGGSEAYESYAADNEIQDLTPIPHVQEAKARTADEINLTKNTLKKELKLPK